MSNDDEWMVTDDNYEQRAGLKMVFDEENYDENSWDTYHREAV